MLVYIVRDNRPGHYRQCEGVAKALARFAPVTVRNVFPNFHWFSRRVLPTLVYRSRLLSPTLALNLLYDFEVETLDPPDIVIASGRRNIVPALFLKSLFGARFVYTGLHDRRWLGEMDLIVTPCPRDAREPRHVYAPVLSPVARSDYGPLRRIRSLEDLRGARLALLVGGECASHRFRDADWARIAGFVAETKASHGIEWHVTTSRRTPRTAVDTLRPLAKSGIIHEFIEYDPDLAGSASRMLGLDGTLVTEDSMTMISEALSAGRPVVALKPARVWPSRQDEAVTAMAALGAAEVMPIAGLSVETLAGAFARLDPVPYDPVEVLRRNLAAEPALLERIGLPRPTVGTDLPVVPRPAPLAGSGAA
ncbi:ELM1/GtrOC1 family putative glycosyltransferase [Prosthecomicrobium sp. N25]|uniref:ELM1/GtrOC1 family putative glycosyltransferase n=1 Tax=Prosthecomicrobium sp. N25 TaxID=3129254 RepID=UPI0030784B62